jgi:hypothetical protein
MIVSRVAELRRLDDLLAALIRGEGGTLGDAEASGLVLQQASLVAPRSPVLAAVMLSDDVSEHVRVTPLDAARVGGGGRAGR